jgi:hypothetical protein
VGRLLAPPFALRKIAFRRDNGRRIAEEAVQEVEVFKIAKQHAAAPK